MEKASPENSFLLHKADMLPPQGENEILFYVGLLVYHLHLALSAIPSKITRTVDCNLGNAQFSLWGDSKPTHWALFFLLDREF